MNPEQWQKAKELFEAARKRPAAERQRFLEENCDGDEELRREVESLLANSDDAASFLSRPAIGEVADVIAGNGKPPLVDTNLSHYKIVKLLGSGGMGEVFLAEDARLDRKVALKVLPESIAADNNRLRRFQQEARAASALNHPNILTIFEFGAENEIHFIASEYVRGQTLRQKLEQQELSLAETLEIAIQIASALSAAHEAGIAHRDVKPDNVMIRADGIVKVLDFGLAKLTENRPATIDTKAETRPQIETQTGMIVGTARYMSPEQARAQAVDERTDIFSLGVVMYEMLAGRQPFAGETTSDVIASILKTEPAPLSQFGVPKELERIVGRALRKDRDERYQHIRDLLIDLRDFKQDLEFEAKLKRASASLPPGRTTSDIPTNATEIQHAQTKSSAEYVVGEIGKRKFVFLAAFVVLLLGIGGLGVWYFGGSIANTTQIESIAVLPFVNESGNADAEYLSDGMTEMLINSLSQLPKLNVKARSSVFRYKGQEVEPQAVGNALGVQAVLSGRVVQRGEQLTLYLSLVDARSGNQIWGEQYNRNQADLVSLQNEVARDVSSKLKTRLSSAEQKQLTKNYTENAEAYRLYLQGRYFWNKRTEKDIRKSIEYFNQAVALDPNYAIAYAGIADAYCSLSFTVAQPENTFLKAREPALRALEIDSGLAEALVSLGFVKERYDWDFAAAEREYKRAIELKPDYATAHHRYGVFLNAMGRVDEAIAELELARRLDPLSLIIATDSCLPYLSSRQYERAAEVLRNALEIDPNFARARQHLATTYRRLGRYEEAIAEIEKAFELTGGQFREDGLRRGGLQLALLYAATGRKNEAEKLAEKTLAAMDERERRGEYVAPMGRAYYYAELGEKEQALFWLEKSYSLRVPGMVELKVSPGFEKIRGDPRFQDLLRRVGLPP